MQVRVAVAFLALAALVLCPSGSEALSRPKGGRMNAGLPDVRDVRSGPPDQWVTQMLDHFDPQNQKTFQQRYQVNDTFYNPKKPYVFLLLGGEGPASNIWLASETAIMVYAQMYGAMVVQLEHRFYGDTQPLPDLSTANLKFLTSQQALADAAYFTTYLRANLSLPAATKFVAFGGSYSGALAAWLRMRYPNLIHAAVASSAPVLAKLNFVEYEAVSLASLNTSSNANCVNNLQAGFKQVKTLLQTKDGQAKLAADFKTCKADLSQTLDQQNFMASIAQNFDGVVQYNKDNRKTKTGTIDTVCAMMTSGYDSLVATNAFFMNASNVTCFDSAYDSMITTLSNTTLTDSTEEGARQWTYQTCAEFAFFQTSDSVEDYLGHYPLSLFTQMCQDLFQISPDTVARLVDWTNTFYGGLNVVGTRIVFPNGSIDPWHALGVLSSISKDLPAIYIPGTAHCANMYPPADSDSQALKDARTIIENYLAIWLLQDSAN